MNKVLQGIVLSLASLLATCLLGELALRAVAGGQPPYVRELVTENDLQQFIWRVPERDFVWSGNLGKPKEFAVPSRWNNLAFNDRDRAFPKPDGVFRIVVLGDSFVQALEVPREQSFHQILEARLNAAEPGRYEVIPLGASGWGPRKYLETLRAIGLQFDPDLVIMAFFPGNDVLDDSRHLTEERAQQVEQLKALSSRSYLPDLYTPSPALPGPVRDSYLLAFVGQRLINVRYQAEQARLPARASIPVDLMAFKSPYDPADPEDAEWLRTWAETLDYVREARDVSEAHGAAFLLVSLSDVWRVSDDSLGSLFDSYPAMRQLTWDFEQPERRLEAYSADHGIAYLPLLPAFRDAVQRSGRPLHWAADGHWTPAGHLLAAEMVQDELQGLGYLPPVQAR